MKLSEVKSILKNLDTISFKLPDGSLVPEHFHVTEIGKISKHFIDCGGTVRKEEKVSLQLWNANDYNHRLHPEKFEKIINISEQKLGIEDLEIEVEYQGNTIQKFGLDFDGSQFNLITKKTDCLAKEQCAPKIVRPLIKVGKIVQESCCTPGGGCC